MVHVGAGTCNYKGTDVVKLRLKTTISVYIQLTRSRACLCSYVRVSCRLSVSQGGSVTGRMGRTRKTGEVDEIHRIHHCCMHYDAQDAGESRGLF